MRNFIIFSDFCENVIDFGAGSVLGYLCVVVMSILIRKNVQKVKNCIPNQLGCGRLTGQKSDSPWRAGESGEFRVRKRTRSGRFYERESTLPQHKDGQTRDRT